MDYKQPPPGAKLEMFVKPGCPYCDQARKHYDSLGIAYEEHDAQNDRAAQQRMFAFAANNPTVPAIVIDGAYVRSGWGDPPRG